MIGAAFGGHSETAKVLLDNGADPNPSKQRRLDGFDRSRLLADIPKSPKFCSTAEQRRIKQAKTAGTALMMRGFWRTFRNRQSFARRRSSAESSKRRRWDGFDGRGFMADIPKPSKFCSTTAQIRIRQPKATGTALMLAAFGGHSEIAKVLLDNGADPNLADKDGETALMIANDSRAFRNRQSFAR